MSSEKHNVHISNQLLVVQLEFPAFVFVCLYQHGECVVPTSCHAGGPGRNLGFAFSDLGMHELHELLVGLFRFLQPESAVRKTWRE